MAYTKKPSVPPAFNAAAFVKALTAGTPVNATVAAQYIAWKKWVESTDTYDGADKGGLRDVLDADMKAMDALKADLDNSKENNGVAHASFDQRLKLLEAQINNPPFPG